MTLPVPRYVHEVLGWKAKGLLSWHRPSSAFNLISTPHCFDWVSKSSLARKKTEVICPRCHKTKELPRPWDCMFQPSSYSSFGGGRATWLQYPRVPWPGFTEGQHTVFTTWTSDNLRVLSKGAQTQQAFQTPGLAENEAGQRGGPCFYREEMGTSIDMTISEETLNKLHCPSEGSLSDLEASQNSLSTSGTQLASSEYLISDVLLICRGISKEPGISWAPPLDHKLYPQIVEGFYNQMLSSPK